MTIKIERLSIPKKNSSKKGSSKYPFAKMKVGDCFQLQETNKSNIHNAAIHWAKVNNPDCKFATRAIVKNGIKKSYIWRIQ